MTARWAVERTSGPAAPAHAREAPEPWARTARVHVVHGPALVLGSRQPDDLLGARASTGLEVLRRRSGGGAVLLEPAGQLWVDVLLPRDDPLWDDDVVRGAQWLGEAWAAALEHIGVAGAEVHRGRLHAGAWGELVCFASLGPGEVSVAGRKVVGLSQRRTRAGARFQCLAAPSWRADPLLALLDLPEEDRARAAADLAPEGPDPELDLQALEAAFLESLPA